MDSSEAREHLEMVERIIAASTRKLEVGGEFFVVWGIVGAAFDFIAALIHAGRLPEQAMFANFVVLALAIVFTAARSRWYRTNGTRMTLLQREYLNVLWLAIAITSLAAFTTFNIFTTWTAQSAIWTLTETLVLCYIGMHGNRRAQVGGLIMFASLVAANFSASGLWILGAGVLFGYAGFGVADLLARE